MKKINNSNFETIQEIISGLNFNYEANSALKKEEFLSSWKEIVGEKISKFSKLLDISDDNIATVVCADSFVANELFYEKDKIIAIMREKAENLGIEIKDVVFNYKKWKELTNEEEI